MQVSANKTFTLPGSAAASDRAWSPAPAKKPRNLQDRKTVGEFVGNAFYGTLLKQVQEAKIKGPFGHGGRGEEVFNGQLTLELAKRMGQAQNNPLTDRMYKAIAKRAGTLSGKPRAEVVR